jgi:hypothetical protein
VKNNSPTQRAMAFVLSLTGFIVLFQNLSLSQSVSPQNLGFGSVAVNTSAAKTLTMTDDRQRDLVVESVTVMGTAFTISTPAMPMTLTPGGSTGFVVTFTPPTSGTFDGNVVVTLARHADGGDGSRVVRVPLSGTGAGSGTGSPVLQSISVGPTSASISVGATQQFTATGHYSDGSTQTLASGVTWSSSSTSGRHHRRDRTGYGSGSRKPQYYGLVGWCGQQSGGSAGGDGGARAGAAIDHGEPDSGFGRRRLQPCSSRPPAITAMAAPSLSLRV